MIKNLRKKGFTIVELVIVIAVIAILAAILIPTFSGIIKKANIASDTAMAKNMNTALVMADSEGNVPEDMTKVITVLHEAGYVVGNLNPTTEGYYYIWDSEKNQIVFINDEFTAHYPADADMSNKAKYWATAATAKEAMILGNAGYSIYLEKDVEEVINLNKWVSFDAGIMKASSVIISGSGASTIKTYGQIAELKVENSEGSVDNYGSIGDLTVTAIDSNCFNNYGRIGNVRAITEGVLVNKAVIMNVSVGVQAANVDNTAGIIVASSATATGVEATNNEVELVIEVRTATELQNLAYAVNDGADFSKITIKLMNDIDLSGRTWTPFGAEYDAGTGEMHDKKYTFTGTIDGNGKKITGLSNDGYVGGKAFYIQGAGDSSTGVPYGLITYASGNVTIKNLTVEANIADRESGKGIAAFIGCYDNAFECGSITISNCVANGKLEGQEKVAGFVGTSYVSGRSFKCPVVTIEGCTNNATIIGTAENDDNCRIGGFVGTLNCDDTDLSVGKVRATFKGCTNNGTVTRSNNKEFQSGEFVGATGSGAKQTIKFENCTAKSTVFVGVFNMGASQRIINPEASNNNVTIDLKFGY